MFNLSNKMMSHNFYLNFLGNKNDMVSFYWMNQTRTCGKLTWNLTKNKDVVVALMQIDYNFNDEI